jgi:hypothetical protein
MINAGTKVPKVFREDRRETEYTQRSEKVL